MMLGLASFLAATPSFNSIAWADEWDKRWDVDTPIENCHALAETDLHFHDCLVFLGEVTLDRYVSAMRNNIRRVERNMIDVGQFRKLLQLSEAELPEQDLIDNAFRGTGLGMMWNYQSLPIQIEHQDELNELRLALARHERDFALASEQRDFAQQMVEESHAKRERLREVVDFYHDWREQVAGSFWDDVHPDHRADITLRFEVGS